jgi:hypothetical protein
MAVVLKEAYSLSSPGILLCQESLLQKHTESSLVFSKFISAGYQFVY